MTNIAQKTVNKNKEEEKKKDKYRIVNWKEYKQEKNLA
jgi:hypothetical protein